MDSYLAAARLVASWRDLLGEKLPKPLTAAADTLEAIEFAQEPAARLDPSTVTAGNAEQKIVELASAIAAENAFSEARSRARDSLGGYVLRTAYEVLPDVIASPVEPLFRDAVARFTNAINALPEPNPSAEALVSAGGTVVEYWQQAKSAEMDLDSIDRFMASLSDLYAVRTDPVLRLATPTTRDGLSRLMRAHDSNGALKPLWVAIAEGAQEGHTSWTLNLPDQSRDIRAAIDAIPVPKRPIKFHQF